MIKSVKNLDHYIKLANSGTAQSVDSIMDDLNINTTLAASKIIDYSLGFINSGEGLKRMAHYLFHGTQMQRNYCAIFFNRLGDWQIVREAYLKGLIDYEQYFSR